MTPEIMLVLFILVVAVVLLITEWIPMEVTALLSLGAVTLTGLVTPAEALSGFSNPAVVTVWAMFILSAGLSATGWCSHELAELLQQRVECVLYRLVYLRIGQLVPPCAQELFAVVQLRHTMQALICVFPIVHRTWFLEG